MSRKAVHLIEISAVILASLSLCACSGFSIGDHEFFKSDTKVSKGMQALDECDCATAHNDFRAAIADGEDMQLAYRGEGMAYLNEADYAKAIEAFDMALASSNGMIGEAEYDISYYLAVAEYKSGDAKAAYDTYSAIIALDDEADDAYYMRGKVLLSMGNKDGAMSDYEKVLELEPKDYDHYLRIAIDLKDAGYEDDGNAIINRAMESSSRLSDYQKGVFEYYLGSYTEARNDLEAASEKNDATELVIFLGKTYEQLGDTGYALTLYEKQTAVDPNSGNLYAQLGCAKMQEEDYEGAVQAFEAGIATGDSTAMQSNMFNRIVAYEYLRDFDTAKTLMSEYLERYPDDETAIRENKFIGTR